MLYVNAKSIVIPENSTSIVLDRGSLSKIQNPKGVTFLNKEISPSNVFIGSENIVCNDQFNSIDIVISHDGSIILDGLVSSYLTINNHTNTDYKQFNYLQSIWNVTGPNIDFLLNYIIDHQKWCLIKYRKQNDTTSIIVPIHIFHIELNGQKKRVNSGICKVIYMHRNHMMAIRIIPTKNLKLEKGINLRNSNLNDYGIISEFSENEDLISTNMFAWNNGNLEVWFVKNFKLDQIIHK